MDTLGLVDVGVFFTFFLLLFVWPLFFFFLGGALRSFLPNCPIASNIRSAQKILDLLRGFCFLIICGSLGTSSLLKKRLFFPALPLF